MSAWTRGVYELWDEINYDCKYWTKCRRFVRDTIDFDICVNIGQKGYVVAEHPDIRYTTHYIITQGSGNLVASLKKIIFFDELKVYDVTDYVKDKVLRGT